MKKNTEWNRRRKYRLKYRQREGRHSLRKNIFRRGVEQQVFGKMMTGRKLICSSFPLISDIVCVLQNFPLSEGYRFSSRGFFWCWINKRLKKNKKWFLFLLVGKPALWIDPEFGCENSSFLEVSRQIDNRVGDFFYQNLYRRIFKENRKAGGYGFGPFNENISGRFVLDWPATSSELFCI